MYYKNDDDDYTLFYASPLGKLDRLTLKLLGSDGTSVKNLFGDTDIFENIVDEIISTLDYSSLEFDPDWNDWIDFDDVSFPGSNSVSLN